MASHGESADLIKTHKIQLCRDLPPHHCHYIANKLKVEGIITDDDYQNVWNSGNTHKSRILVESILKRNVPRCSTSFCEALREKELNHLADLIEGKFNPEPKATTLQKQNIRYYFSQITNKLRADDILHKFPTILDEHTRQEVLAKTSFISQTESLLHYALKSNESILKLIDALKSGECGDYSHIVDLIETDAGISRLAINQGIMDQQSNFDQNVSMENQFNSAIIKATQSQVQNLDPDITLHGHLEVDASNIPIVYPTYIRSEFYKGGNSYQAGEFRPSTTQTSEIQRQGHNVHFAGLVKLVNRKKFTALIGPAGCGKTTTSKRLVRATNDLVPFHLRFMDINYDEKISARQLLMDYLFPDLDESTQRSAFQWMKENPEKCVFIMDGYDQAVWSLENVKPVNASYDTPLTIQQLVANLCCKKFFKQSMLIFTSRPHAMISIPYELRPDITIDIKDLTTDNMKKLFYAFARERSDELWELLYTNAPQLFDLCHNPILLQFIIIAALYSSPDDLSSITTITGVFGSVLEHLRHSDHARGLDINRLWEPLGKMAYKGMKRKSVVFTIEDLKKEGLIDVDVQDLVIIIVRQLGFNQRLFDGDKIIFFIHQMLQEKFAAKYISSYMSMDEFRQVIDEVAAGGHWAMVRRFLCGLLLGKDNKQGKTALFLSKMLEFLQDNSTYPSWHEEMPELFVDLLEACDEKFNEFVKIIPTDVTCDWRFAQTAIQIHALKRVLLMREKPVKCIDLRQIDSDEIIGRFLAALKDMKCKIGKLDLSNSLVGERMDSILLHVERSDKIVLEKCGIKDVSKLSEKIKNKKSKTVLCLGENPIGDEGLKQIATCVDKTRKLSLLECEICKVKPLADSIVDKKCLLTCLDLSYNPIGNMGLQHLASCVSYIHKLLLSECGVIDLQALVEPMLQQQSKVLNLDIAGNKIGNQGINQLSLFVHKLDILDVSDCGVTDVTQFCDAVSNRATKMETLSLQENAIGLKGALSLFECSNKIEFVTLRSEDTTEEGMQKLRSMISTRPHDERELGIAFFID